MEKTILLPSDKCEVMEADWGSLTWYANAAQGNSQEMTVGKCIIHPGQENPFHSHPNCSEILVLMQGTLSHKIEDGKEVVMNPGDVISVPPNLPHNARNIGDEDAVMYVSFSSAFREANSE